jgi:branched-chain amino acid transport system ATP-binding protein
VLHGVNMRVNEGEVVSLLGRNGAGRTTTMRAIVGLTGRRTGSIRIRGQEAIKLPPHRSPAWAWATAPRSAASSPACRPRRT